MSWARPALFADFATTDVDEKVLRQTTGNAGAQIDFSITSLHALDLILSVGRPGPSRTAANPPPKRWSR